MKRYARTVNLRDDPEVIRQYEAYHAHVWPEVNAGIERSGVRQMIIWRYGRQLFMYMETADDYDLNTLPPPPESVHPREREWDLLMRGFQETVPGAPPGSKWVEMKEVYALRA